MSIKTLQERFYDLGQKMTTESGNGKLYNISDVGILIRIAREIGADSLNDPAAAEEQVQQLLAEAEDQQDKDFVVLAFQKAQEQLLHPDLHTSSLRLRESTFQKLHDLASQRNLKVWQLIDELIGTKSY